MADDRDMRPSLHGSGVAVELGMPCRRMPAHGREEPEAGGVAGLFGASCFVAALSLDVLTLPLRGC